MQKIRSMQSATGTNRGFTILELMVGITVLGILLGIGVPAFNDMIRNNRAAAQTNELIAALSLARSEASKRGMPVTICAANDAQQDSCAPPDTNDWGNGWLVFSDRIDTAGVIDDGDELLQTSHAVTGGLQLTSGDIGFVRFSPNGTLISTAVTFRLQHQQCSGANQRQISIIATGRASLAKVPCS